MTEVDIEQLSVEALREHIAKAQHLLDEKVGEERDRVIQDAEQQLAKLGLSLAEAMGRQRSAPAPERGKRQLRAKFRHPENSETTWSGVGRKPKWIREAEETGQLEALRIPG